MSETKPLRQQALEKLGTNTPTWIIEASESLAESYASPLRERIAELEDVEHRFAAIRVALANYMASEGCNCCQDVAKHDEAEDALGVLLDVPKFDNGSCYDFSTFQTIYK